MSKAAARHRAQPALELLEDAVRLLRRAPAPVLVLHLLGSAPCALFAVFFFTDLSRSAFAAEHVFESALGLALLYCWMKSCQAASAAHLRAVLLHEAPPQWTTARLLRLTAAQTILQPVGLALRLIALLIAVPYVWVSTFFQNAVVLGDGTPESLRALIASSWTEAKRWPLQAHALAALLTIFGFFIYLNVASLIAVAPLLMKMFLGLETAASRYSNGMVNPTFLVAVYAAMYLLLDPLRKAAVVLRCFHGRSLRTGEDLRVELKGRRKDLPGAEKAARGRAALQGASREEDRNLFRGAAALECGASPRRFLHALICATLLLTSAPIGHAAAAAPRVEPPQLERAIEDVLDRREYTWRGEREREPKKPERKLTFIEQWLKDFREWRERQMRQIARSLSRLFRKLFGERGDRSRNGASLAWFESPKLLYGACFVAVAAIVAILIIRYRRRPEHEITATAVAATPDLRSDDVSADLLPEDGWLQLARDLIDRSELRLALRALYLASLAHLGSRQFIQLARHKSNHDYERELRRRARTQADLLDAFDTNLGAFESVWYGDHAVTPDTLGEFSRNLERIRAA